MIAALVNITSTRIKPNRRVLTISTSKRIDRSYPRPLLKFTQGMTSPIGPVRLGSNSFLVTSFGSRATKNPELNELQDEVDQPRDEYQDKHDSLFWF